MSSPDADAIPPITGDPRIDRALAALDLSGPVAEHQRVLAGVHEVLAEVLNRPRDDPQR